VVGVWIGVTTLSTLFALNPMQSLIGSAWRSQGLLAVVFFGVLFWAASHAGSLFRAALAQLLTLAVIPICVFALWSAGANGWSRDYAASTAGNTNFLASWLVVVLLYCVPFWLERVRRWARPFTGEQRYLLGLLILSLLLAVATLIICGSRGALLGLLLGGLIGIVGFVKLIGRQRLLLGIGVALLVFGVVYLVAGRVVPDSVPFARLLRPYDETRITVWNYAAEQVIRQAEPLQAADGSLDRWAALRPILGFGLENIDQIQVRFGDPFSNTAYVDHFHNLIFDTLMMQGWLGLLALAAVYLCAAGLCLARLGLLSRATWWRWLLVESGSIIAGIVIVSFIIPQLSFGGGAPLGAALGAVLGLIIWLLLPTATKPIERLDSQQVLILSTLCIIVAQWVDNQFGFTQIITQTLWWMVLGGLVAITRQPTPAEGKPIEIEPQHWYGAALALGLLLLASFGEPLQSTTLSSAIGTRELPLLLLCLLLGTLLGGFGNIYAVPAAKRTNQLITATIQLVAFWAVFWLIKTSIAGYSGGVFDTATASAKPEALAGAVRWLPLVGILAVTGGVLGFLRLSELRKLPAVLFLVIGLFWVVGSLAYSHSYSSTALHHIAGVYTADGQQHSFDVADAAFTSSLQLAPTNIQGRVDWLYSFLTRTQVPQVRAQMRQRIEEQTALLVKLAPFYPNTRTWQLFQKELANAPK
jgi:O-antigen ligase